MKKSLLKNKVPQKKKKKKMEKLGINNELEQFTELLERCNF